MLMGMNASYQQVVSRRGSPELTVEKVCKDTLWTCTLA
jgi:hypothetical protein